MTNTCQVTFYNNLYLLYVCMLDMDPKQYAFFQDFKHNLENDFLFWSTTIG